MLDLSSLGITNVGSIFHNLSTPALYEFYGATRDPMA